MTPLLFAARNQFEHLGRVRDLEKTLLGAIDRCVVLAGTATMRGQLGSLREIVPPVDSSGPDRIDRLRQLLVRLQGLVALHDQPAAPDRAIAETVVDTPKEPAPAPIDLDSPVQFVRGVGPRLSELLRQHGVATVSDLLHLLPRHYEDRRRAKAISDLEEGVHCTVEGEVAAKSLRRIRGRATLDVALQDDTGVVYLVWFRVPGRSFADRFVRGRRFRAAGLVKRYQGRLQIVHPETQVVDGGEAQEAASDAIVPVYPEIEGIRPAQLRTIIGHALGSAGNLSEVLPAALREHRQLPAIYEAIVCIHQPPVHTPLDRLERMATPWHGRMIYEELFLLQLGVLQRRALFGHQAGKAVALPRQLTQEAAELFPFELTGAQARVLNEIEADLRSQVPMHRLLQGDVGSGKTAVAVAAAAAVALCGLQAAIMAPTELLAEQHGRVAVQTLTRVGVRVGMLTGGIGASERRDVLAQLESGRMQVVVGTHALIQQDVRYHALALAVVDEQHRFGVMQRARLLELGARGLGAQPHLLVMTATPIPRTLAMTVYGDLDASMLDELPPGRKAITTRLCRGNERESAYALVRQEVAAGRQAYVVFPLVEGSDKEGMDAVRDASSAYEELAAGALAGLRLGLVHGRLTSDDKDRVMRSFVRGELDVLVATTVIEVGIDVANATVMVIEHAERFGLSQLHQLRGRVGRGSQASHCLLVAYFHPSDDAWRRLRIMEQTQDGFRIAEEDLAIRGPGDFLGTRQSGLPVFSVANLMRDQKILAAARQDAMALLAEDPELVRPDHAGLARAVEELWPTLLSLAQVG